MSFQCTGYNFCAAVITVLGSSGTQQSGILLPFPAIFPNEKIFVYLLVVEWKIQSSSCFCFGLTAGLSISQRLRQEKVVIVVLVVVVIIITTIRIITIIIITMMIVVVVVAITNNINGMKPVSFACIERKRTVAVTAVKNNLYIVYFWFLLLGL